MYYRSWNKNQFGTISRNLPVGENLQDHYGTGALTFTVDQVLVISTNFAQCCIVLKILVNVFSACVVGAD